MGEDNMRKKLILIIIFLAFIGNVANSQENTAIERWKKRIKEFPIANNKIEMQLTKSFPTDEEKIYLNEAVSLAHDTDWNIYVVDRRNSNVVVFNSKGEYLYSFGRRGQGPGDLYYPQNISILKNNIVVYEAGNNRIQFFNMKGKSLKFIQMFKAYHNVILSKKGIIYGVPRHIIPGTGQKMIDVINSEGELVKSFGELKELLMNVEMGTTAELSLINDESEILLVYDFIPIIERYSINGELLSSVKITNPIIDDEAKNNQNHLSKGELGLRTILPAVRTYENKTYLLHSWPRVEILELDKNYNIEKIFFSIVSWDFHVRDFLINRDGEQTTVYCIPMGSYENMKIHVFEVKK